MGTEVIAKRTPWDTPTLLRAYGAAWHALGVVPSRYTLAICWGQGALETGRGGFGCFNSNIGNVMGEDPATGCFHVLSKAPECAVNPYAIPGATVLTTSHVACAPGTSPYLPAGGSRFRAYADLESGCLDKLRVLARLWPRALWVLANARGAADALAYATELLRGVGEPLTPALAAAVLGKPTLTDVPGGARKYHTSAPSAYAGSVHSLADECLRHTPEGSFPPAPSMHPQLVTLEVLADLSLDVPATPLRAGEGEHTVPTPDVEL